MNPLYKKVIGW